MQWPGTPAAVAGSDWPQLAHRHGKGEREPPWRSGGGPKESQERVSERKRGRSRRERETERDGRKGRELTKLKQI